MLKHTAVFLSLLYITTAAPRIPNLVPARKNCHTTNRTLRRVFRAYVRNLEVCGNGDAAPLQSLFTHDTIIFFGKTITVGLENIRPSAVTCTVPAPVGFKGLTVSSGVKSLVGNSVYFSLTYAFEGFEKYTSFGVVTVCGRKIVRIADEFDLRELVRVE